MAYPLNVKTRLVSFGGAATVEAGIPLHIRISTESSRSLIWVEDGYRLESLAALYMSATDGQEIIFEVPTTDQNGWLDASTRQAIIVEPGEASHLYTTKLEIFTEDHELIRTYEIGPYAVPEGPGTLDADLLNPNYDPIEGTLTVYIPGPDGELSAAGQQAAADAIQAAIDAEGYRDEAEAFAADTVELQDAAVAALIDTPGSATQTQLNATFAARDGWAKTALQEMETLAPAINTPTLTYADGHSTSSLTSPVEYRPSICGTGSQVTNWNGQNDPVFVFHPGLFRTFNGGSADMCMEGQTIPSAPAASRWPIIVEFDTSATVDKVEVAFYGSSALDMKIEVNNNPAVTTAIIPGPNGLTAGKRALLTFPDARVRRLRLYLYGAIGLYAVRVPTGTSISKPTDTPRVGAFIGDSFVGGSLTSATSPFAGAGWSETFALPVLKSLGCNRFVLAAVGGQGLVAGTAPYSTRVSAVLGMSPAVLCVNGSINDGTTGTGVQVAAENLLDATTTIPERYMIGTMRNGYAENHAACAAAAESRAVPFVDMLDFLNGTGRAGAPTGDGNRDFYLLPDGAHPTYAGHRAIASHIVRAIAVKKSIV